MRTSLLAASVLAVAAGQPAVAGVSSSAFLDRYASVEQHNALVVTGTGKSFRAAPQNGNNIITVSYTCTATAFAVISTSITSCRMYTDLAGTGFVPPSGSPPTSFDAGPVTNEGPVATQTGTRRLTGNTVTLCASGESNAGLFSGVTEEVCVLLG